MPIMNDQTRKRVGQILSDKLSHPATMLLFTGDDPHAKEYMDAAREVAQELAELSQGVLSMREIKVAEQPDEAVQYGITDRLPAFVLLNADGVDQNFRLYGAPLGYEFTILLDDLIDVSNQATRLSPATIAELKAITGDVMIQVFSTPS